MKKSKIKLACASLTLNFIIPQNISADWSYHELDEMEILVTDFNCENDNDFKNILIDIIINPEKGFSLRTYSLALLLKKYKKFSEFASFFENTVVKKYNERRNYAPLTNEKEIIGDSEELLSTVLSGTYRETFPYLLYESLKKCDFFENKSLLSEKIWNKWLEYLSTKTFVSDFNNPEESFREITDYFRFYTMKSIREILLKIENNTLNTDKKQEFLKSAKENFSKIGLNLFKTENNIETLDFDVIKEINKKILEYQKVCLEHPEYNEMLITILKNDIENPENINKEKTKCRVIKQQKESQSKKQSESLSVKNKNIYIFEKDQTGKTIHKWKWETLPNVPDEFGIDADDAYMDCLTGAFVWHLYGESDNVATPKQFQLTWEDSCNQVKHLTNTIQVKKLNPPVKYSRTSLIDDDSSLISILISSLKTKIGKVRLQEKIFYANNVLWFQTINMNKPTQNVVSSILAGTLEGKLYEYIVRQKVPVIIEIPESDEQGTEHYRYGVITDIEVDYANINKSGVQIRNVKFWDPLYRRKCTWDLKILSECCTSFCTLTN